MDPIIRRKKLLQLVGLSDSTVRRKEVAGEFPSRIRLGRHAVGWRLSEIEAWLEGRPRVERDSAHG